MSICKCEYTYAQWIRTTQIWSNQFITDFNVQWLFNILRGMRLWMLYAMKERNLNETSVYGWRLVTYGIEG